MIQQQFFIEGKYLGSAERYTILQDGELVPPSPRAYFCGTCGEVWARCPVVGASSPRHWRFISRNCRKHPTRWIQDPGGSLYQPFDTEFTNGFPEAVQRWELDRLLDFYERQFNGQG